MNHFDSLEFVKKSKELGANEQLAEYQARSIENAINIAVNTTRIDMKNKELATKMDIKEVELSIKEVELRLSAEIHKSKIETIVWVGGILVTLLVASGIIQHFLKF
ncbi:MAG: hypothetical protein QG673_686 [Pseudomonadota bacterium]|nr:hypothetical protein [Pseudomonadota bacterium]